jgi:outer membrane protein assembly factor BamB
VVTVDRAIENGVEVILNHVEPYRLPGQPTGIRLTPEFSIDFGADDIGAMGIADSTSFEVDAAENLYFFYTNKKGDLIFQFDSQGEFLRSFGPKGQGPGEIEYINHTGFDLGGNLLISDMGNRKVLLYGVDGHLVQEIRYPAGARLFIPLENGNGFNLWSRPDETGSKIQRGYHILSPEHEELKILDRQTPYDLDELGFRGIVSNPLLQARIFHNAVYIANEERGYELWKYDLNGKLTQIIRKEYHPVRITDAEKEERSKPFEQYGGKVWFPEYWLPFGNFLLDDDGNIFVRTFKKNDTTGEYFFDVFNPEGVFIFRQSFNIFTAGDKNVCARFKNERLYCFEEKPDSFRVFKSYRLEM